MCESIILLKIFRIVDSLLNLAKVLIPIIIIVSTIMEFSKVSMSGTPEDLQKVSSKIPVRFLAALIIFLLPSTVMWIVGILDPTIDKNSVVCLLDVDDEMIENVYEINADNAVLNAETNLTSADYDTAKNLVDHVTNQSKKAALDARLKLVDSVLSQKSEEAKKKRIESIKKNKKTATTAANLGGVDSPLNLPYYGQCSDAYRRISVPGKGTYNTCGCGCGYTSLAMIVDGLTGSKLTPSGTVSRLWPGSGACAISDSALTSSTTRSMGVVPTTIFGRGSGLSADAKKQKIVEALQGGSAVELLIPGHYIALGGISNGKIAVLDPGSSANNGNYTIDELYNKYYNHKNRCSSQGKCGFMMAIGYKKG